MTDNLPRGDAAHDLITRPLQNPSEGLARVVRALNRSDVAALLWRWDRESRSLILDHCHSADPRDTFEALRHVRVRTSPKSLRTAVDPRRHAALTAWLRMSNRAGAHYLSELIPAHGSDSRGLLEVVADEPFVSGSADLAQLFANAIATAVRHERERRVAATVGPLIRWIANGRTRDDWFAAAAGTLRQATNAQAVAVFAYRADLRLGLAASDPPPSKERDRFVTSRPYPAAQIVETSGVARLRDFGDPDERRDKFGTGHYDEELIRRIEDHIVAGRVRGWLSCPLLFEQSLAAVVVLLNKTDTLSEEFTPLDVELAMVATRFLAGVLPSATLPQAITALANWTHQGTLNDPATRSGLLRLLSETLPGFVGAVISRRSPNGDESQVWIGAPQTDITMRALPATNPERGQYVQSFPIPSLVDDQAAVASSPTSSLVLILRRPELDPYEKHLISLVCRELSHLLLEEELREERRGFVQVRHALRAAITPIAGYAYEAESTFGLHRRSCTAGRPLQDRMEKALSRLGGFAVTAHNVLQETRFLLGQITPDTVRPQLCDLGYLIEGAVNSLRPHATRRDIRLQYVPWRFEANVDPDLMHIAFFNILDNAVKYSRRSRSVVVEVKGNVAGWSVSVTSFGRSMPPEFLAGTFKPFTHTAVDGLEDTTPGTGLGLAVSAAIIESHGGQLNVRSEQPPAEPSTWRTRVTLRIETKES